MPEIVHGLRTQFDGSGDRNLITFCGACFGSGETRESLEKRLGYRFANEDSEVTCPRCRRSKWMRVYSPGSNGIDTED